MEAIVTKAKGSLERRERTPSTLMASASSINKLLESSPVREEERGIVVCLWSVVKT